MNVTPKKLRELLDAGLVCVLVDATHPDCIVPPEHKGNEHLVLNLSYAFRGHRSHFDLDALRVSLTFGAQEFRCTLPWDSFLDAQLVRRNVDALPPPAPPRAHLRLVK